MAKQKSSVRVEELSIKYKNDSSKLIKELKKLVQEGQRTGDILLTGAACHQLSIVYYDLSDWDNMLINSIKAVTYLDKTEEHELRARAHITLSVAYDEQENNLMSFEESDKAYQILKKRRNNSSLRIIALNNLATCYRMMGDIKSGVKMLDECIKQIEKNTPEDIENLAMVIINKANFYRESGHMEKSREILNSISDWINNVEFKPLVCDYYLRLAYNYYALGDKKEARNHTIKAISIFPENTFALPVYDDFREVGHFIIENQERDLADQIFNIMTAFEEKTKGAFEQTIAYRFLADYYRGLNNFEKASEYYVKLDEIYENRMEEQKGSQCKAYTKMKRAALELEKLNKAIKEKEYLGSREPLTGLLNRSALIDVTTDFFDIALKRKQKVGAIFVDIDYFKECNDTYGHAKGDEIIKIIADTCKLEENDNVRFARYGGDEFFGITHGLNDEAILEIAKHICSNVRSKAIPNENSPYKTLTLSVGVINFEMKDNQKTIIDMVKFSDKAMYHAKNDGKNAIFLLEYNSNNELTFKKIDY